MKFTGTKYICTSTSPAKNHDFNNQPNRCYVYIRQCHLLNAELYARLLYLYISATAIIKREKIKEREIWI